MTSNRGKTLVKGHTLYREGWAHDQDGVPFYAGNLCSGFGKCSCGALSPWLETRNARKQWHAQHKAELKGERE